MQNPFRIAFNVVSTLGFRRGLICFLMGASPPMLSAAPKWQAMQHGQYSLDVIEIQDLSRLALYLNNADGQPLLHFSALAAQLRPCEQLSFAMNAGMFHANFQPVGLYIENSKMRYPLNTTEQAEGNFFMQPNGVLAWNERSARIMTTQAFKTQSVLYAYATQSGPMLLINGEINPKFLPDAQSLKIRNGVGVKNNSLYFVISRQAMRFYDFAQFMQQQLKLKQALYLDGGSVPSLYLADPDIQRQQRFMGPMLAYVTAQACKPESR